MMQRVEFSQAGDALESEIVLSSVDAKFATSIAASREAALEQLYRLDVHAYAQTRNHFQGAVTGLSAAIENGILSEVEIVQWLQNSLAEDWPNAYRFIQQLAWREFFQQKWRADFMAPKQAQQAYKTGWQDADYVQQIPAEILQANTQSALINQLITTLQTTGYLHNHGRLYLASYMVHWLRVHWRIGADWMLALLRDANLASNHFSWQWVASTNSPKPYIFNLQNAQKFCGECYDTSPQNNVPLDDSYESLQLRLFPNIAMANGGPA